MNPTEDDYICWCSCGCLGKAQGIPDIIGNVLYFWDLVVVG